jgi:hypothetical protein
MKMPRFFILIAAFALVSTLALQSIESIHSNCWADPFLPVLRADPRAGDPDEPTSGYFVPFDDEATSAVVSTEDKQSSPSDYALAERPSWASRILNSRIFAWLFGGGR